MTTTFEPRAAVRPCSRSRQRLAANLMWDTGTGSAHVAVDELTHCPCKGRADAAAAGLA